MTSTEITNLLLIAQASISLLIALRAFSRYARSGNDVLFILGMSMGIIAIVGVIGLIGDNYFVGQFSTKWFRYAAQVVSYAFIFLCSLRSAVKYMHLVKRWQMIFAALLLVLLFLTPQLPQFSNPGVEASVSFLRAVICFAICLTYAGIFMQKETRFSLLMGLAFLLISFGIAVTTPWYFEQARVLYLYVGDSMRTTGLVVLFVAFLVG
ncbi:MAG TPA: hypothetical protein VGU68_12165 [Ktedonobacteraceae bacterium]|nr:hypothetical protein [Ktedonobacteraceae bacterium]